MKILFQKILSLDKDKAHCYLLVLEEDFKILLDCGINSCFDFKKYRQFEKDIRQVQLVLISHSSLEYSGAFAFLVDQFKLNPKIFYTTQPIMRYSPLNLHEEILNFRLETYNKKIFNKIYAYYEEIQLVKPFQKKQIELKYEKLRSHQQKSDSVKANAKKINFSCYNAGGHLGSIFWRITYGLINIIYLVQYNNYSMHHISGLDIESLKMQSTHLLITDTYTVREEPKKEKLYLQIKKMVLDFYRKNYLDPNKSKPINKDLQNEPKLLIICYPNQLIIEALFVLRKIISQLQETTSFQKIGIVHLSSRFLELIKSQSQYFSNQFKVILQKMNQYFEPSLAINNRINISSYSAIEGILSAQINQNITIVQIASDFKHQKIDETKRQALQQMRIFQEEQQKVVDIPNRSSLLNIEAEQNHNNANMMEVEEQVIGSIKAQSLVKQEVHQDNVKIQQDMSIVPEKLQLKGKYISLIGGFPTFHFSRKEKDEEVNDYGLRHHSQVSGRPDRKTIYQYQQNQEDNLDDQLLSKTKSTIEIMNISFDIPPTINHANKKLFSQMRKQISIHGKNVHKTEYNSSLRIIQQIKPRDIILLNISSEKRQICLDYQRDIQKMFNTKLFEKKVTLFDINLKNQCYLSYKNELLEYKMNYLPELQMKKIQKVRGTIVKSGNSLHIHLDCIEDNEIMNFKMEKFYVAMRSKMKCKFIGSGIEIEGIKLYRKDNEIILEGEYSQQYFKVRKELYLFLRIQ